MTHFPSYHFVAGPAVAADIDASDVNPAPRIDEEGESDLLFFLVQLGRRIDIGKRITVVAQPVGNELDRFRQLLPGKHVAGGKLDQCAQLILGNQ